MTYCEKRPTQADIRVQPDLYAMLPCIRSKRHRGDHENSAGQKWGQSGSRGEETAHGMRAVGEDQQIDTDVVTGIMAERVHQQFEMNDEFECECYLIDPSIRGEHDPWGTCGHVIRGNPQVVLDEWHPHHIEKRRKGPKANRRNVFRSRSRPDNIAVLAPPCHDKAEKNQPEFSGSTS